MVRGFIADIIYIYVYIYIYTNVSMRLQGCQQVTKTHDLQWKEETHNSIHDKYTLPNIPYLTP
jgi:hypothetical protein